MRMRCACARVAGLANLAAFLSHTLVNSSCPAQGQR